MNIKFFARNRQNLFAHMENNSMAVLFSGKAPKKSADEKYPFTINRNFYYLCGIEEQNIMIILSKVDEVQESTLFIKKADPVRAKWVGETISEEKAKEISGITTIKHVENFTGALHNCLRGDEVECVYFDLERDSWAEEITYVQSFGRECKDKYPQIRVKDVYPTIAELRKIKSNEEVEALREAIHITDEGIKSLMENAKAGIYEYQLEACFDFVLKSSGIKDYAFKTIAASGKNATVLHYESNDSMIEKDSLILFDLGAQYKYYNADISRTFPVSGKFSKRQKTFYNIVLKAQAAVIEAIKPGTSFSRLDEIVKEIYFEELSKLEMVKDESDVAKYYYHGVSHFLGLDTHDVGSRKGELKPGMVLTVEPGIYIEEERIGIRIEDDILVTENGCDNLSKSIIKTVDEIERFMSR
ncbi:MAG: aminopeptidase P N-terminal domain-containing protein [Cellulosilyticaceae bacterium]